MSFRQRISAVASSVVSKRSAMVCVALITATMAESSANDRRLAAEPLGIIRDNMFQLVSGEFQASGLFRRSDLSGENVDVLEETISGVFDHAADSSLVRRDRVRVEGSSRMLDYHPMTWFVHRGDATIEVLGARGKQDGWSVGIHPPRSSREASPFLQPVIDLRVMPLVRYQHLDISPDDLSGLFETAPVEASQDGELTLLTLSDDTALSRWWCDPQQGGQVVRYTQTPQRTAVEERLEQRLRSRGAEHLMGLGKPTAESTTTWREVNGVWVPATYHLDDEHMHSRISLTLSFQWTAVNETVDPAVFDWRSWPLPAGSRVVDVRLGVENQVTLQEVNRAHEVELPEKIELNDDRLSRWLILANVAVIGGAIGVMLRRRKRPSAESQ